MKLLNFFGLYTRADVAKAFDAGRELAYEEQLSIEHWPHEDQKPIFARAPTSESVREGEPS